MDYCGSSKYANDENSISGYASKAAAPQQQQYQSHQASGGNFEDTTNKTPTRFYNAAEKTPAAAGKAPAQTIVGTTTLSDVKNRLMMMQKNKEELEEKLRRINRMPQY